MGKSHLIRALYQAAGKHYNSRAGKNFNEVKILLLALTGKAAYGIKGNTVHSALAIPACQSLKTYKPLDSSRLNTLRCKLGAVQLIFLHEISMIGNTMLNVQINNRLKDIKGSKEVFGGISIIALGDLFQLEPVMDSYVFKDMKNSDYGSLAPNLWQDYSNMDVNVFSETQLCYLDSDTDYSITGYTLFRNDSQLDVFNTRPYSGTAVYSKIPFLPGYPVCNNTGGVEITIIKVTTVPHITIIGIYRSPRVPIRQMCVALIGLLTLDISGFKVFIGDFNINWLNEKDKIPLYNLFIRDHSYRQLVSCSTTDNRTTIDHVYTNLPESQIHVHILETYFSDHKAICALIQK